MPTIPPTLTDAPASPDRADRATFSARSIALDNFTKNVQIPELRLALANVASNAGEAYTSAGTATTQAGLATTNGAAQVALATTQAGNAAASATTASTQATTATTQADNAATSASTATTQAGISTAQAVISTTKAGEASSSATAASASAAAASAITGIPIVSGNALKVLRVNAAGAGIEWAVGTTVQAPPTLTAPAQSVPGYAINISFAGSSALVAQSIASFVVTWWDGSTEVVAAAGNAGSASKAVAGIVGDVKTVSVVSVDTLGNQSAATADSVTLVANNPPTGTLTISAPTTVMDGSSGNQISFSGITDPDSGDAVSYTITSSGLFTPSKTAGIAAGEIVTFTAADVAVNTVSSITVKAVDLFGGETAPASASITIRVASVIGVVLKTTGGGGGTWSHVDPDGNDIADPGTSWFNAAAPWSGIVDQTIDAQSMVKIPKFYYKVGAVAAGANIGKTAWWIADAAVAGFTPHPAFMNAGAAVDQFWYGKYQASMQSTKLASVAAVLPAVSINLTTFIANAANRNTGGVTGFMLHSFWQWSAIQFLYLVENKTMDCQTKTGQGLVSASAAENVDSATVAQATYRGMVGLWGNVYQWMDGLRTTAGAIYVWDASGNKTFTNTGKTTGAAGSKYPLTFVSDGTPPLAAGFLPATFAATGAAATTPDQQYFSDAGEYFPNVGGNWVNAAGAGLWFVGCDYAASSAGASFGARLAKV